MFRKRQITFYLPSLLCGKATSFIRFTRGCSQKTRASSRCTAFEGTGHCGTKRLGNGAGEENWGERQSLGKGRFASLPYLFYVLPSQISSMPPTPILQKSSFFHPTTCKPPGAKEMRKLYMAMIISLPSFQNFFHKRRAQVGS